ncbi:MAG: ornithine carbamoyltransferase [Gammaproteobacteria bacterium]|nr:MAG: ornithine carbamoyltransferase [Gammaproteobacteria bacterium]PIE35199.1 MAG: ornithine carbamoyltransferase [Gammaproteobacteria bacterium]
MRHFLSELDLSPDEFRRIIARGSEFRRAHHEGRNEALFPGRVLALIFEKSSTRTRVSFETGMAHFGGKALYLSPNDTQLGRGEPLEDTARVLSEMVDAVAIRTFSQAELESFSDVSTVPVINALTDLLHPCQLLADMQTFFEHRGDIAGKRVAWVGDGNNMCNSYINCALLLGFELRIACPEGYGPDQDLLEQAGNNAIRVDSPEEACHHADLVVTDVWASMGQEEEQQAREEAFAGYKVTAPLMERGAHNALFMHCLPAHRGEEVAADVIDGPQSVVWAEAGNRLHAQKALLEFLFNEQTR